MILSSGIHDLVSKARDDYKCKSCRVLRVSRSDEGDISSRAPTRWGFHKSPINKPTYLRHETEDNNTIRTRSQQKAARSRPASKFMPQVGKACRIKMQVLERENTTS